MSVRRGAPQTQHEASGALARKAAPAPVPGIREPGPYARDQVTEETRTRGQYCKKRAAGFRGGRSCRPRLLPQGERNAFGRSCARCQGGRGPCYAVTVMLTFCCHKIARQL
jgi:hypothetical protein